MFDVNNIPEIPKELKLKYSMFYEKHETNFVKNFALMYNIKNDKNDLKLHIVIDTIYIITTQSVDLQDKELKTFLNDYKRMMNMDTLHIKICHKTIAYSFGK